MLREGVELVPGYKLQRFLGRGGFGEVWSATAPGGMRAALKIIRLEGKQGLKEYNSIQRLKTIHHPHLLPINALWLLDDNANAIDTEPFEGEQDTWRVGELEGDVPRPSMLVLAMPLGEMNLFELLEEHRRKGDQGVPPEPLLEYLSDVAKGLDFLNRSTPADSEFGVQHCDVKPHNILLMGNAAMICDFGLARVLSDQRATSGTAVSPAYAAPEFLRDNRPSSATDQYSLAITYYELRTGELPFVATSPVDVRESHLRGDLHLEKLNSAEETVIRRATALNPADRYATVGEMVQQLTAAVRERPTVADPRVTLVDVNVPEVGAYSSLHDSREPKTVVMQATGNDTVRLAPGDPRLTASDVSTLAGRHQQSSHSNKSPSWLRKHRDKLSIVGVALLAALVWFVILREDDSTNTDEEEPKVAQVEESDEEKNEPVKFDGPENGSDDELNDDDLLLIPEPENTEPAADETATTSQDPEPGETIGEPQDDLDLLPPAGKPDNSVEAGGSPETTDTSTEVLKPMTSEEPDTGSPNLDLAAAAAINEEASAHLQSGDEFNRAKKTRHAVAEYTKALKLQSTDPQLLYKLHTRRAIACRKEGSPKFQQKALSDFQKAVSHAANNKRKSGLYFSRGTLLLEMKRPAEAVEDLTRAIELAPDNAYLYQARAEAFRQRNNAGDAGRASQDDAEAKSLSAGGSPNAT